MLIPGYFVSRQRCRSSATSGLPPYRKCEYPLFAEREHTSLIKSGPNTRFISRCFWHRPTHTVGMPSGSTNKAESRILRNSGSRLASITPWTPVTHTYPFDWEPILSSTNSIAVCKFTAWIPTPRTLARAGLIGALSDMFEGDTTGFFEFTFNPLIGNVQACFECNPRCPAQHL